LVEILNTVRVSWFILGGSEFGKHRGLGEIAAFARLPFVVLLDQNRTGGTATQYRSRS